MKYNKPVFRVISLNVEILANIKKSTFDRGGHQ